MCVVVSSLRIVSLKISYSTTDYIFSESYNLKEKNG